MENIQSSFPCPCSNLTAESEIHTQTGQKFPAAKCHGTCHGGPRQIAGAVASVMMEKFRIFVLLTE